MHHDPEGQQRQCQSHRPLADPDRGDPDGDRVDPLGLPAATPRDDRPLALGSRSRCGCWPCCSACWRPCALVHDRAEEEAGDVDHPPVRRQRQHEHQRRGPRQVAMGRGDGDARADVARRSRHSPRTSTPGSTSSTRSSRKPRKETSRPRPSPRGSRPIWARRCSMPRSGRRGRAGRSRARSSSRTSRRIRASIPWWPPAN